MMLFLLAIFGLMLIGIGFFVADLFRSVVLAAIVSSFGAGMFASSVVRITQAVLA